MFANKGINLINVTNHETGNFGSKYTSCDIKTVNSTYNSLISKYTSFSCAYVTSLFLHKFDTYKNDWSLTAINGSPKLLKKIFYNDATIFELTSTRSRVEKCRMLKNVNTP